jgi:hypothetical protein
LLSCTSRLRDRTLTVTGDNDPNVVEVAVTELRTAITCDGVTLLADTARRLRIRTQRGSDTVNILLDGSTLDRAVQLDVDLGSGADSASFKAVDAVIGEAGVFEMLVKGSSSGDSLVWEFDGELDGLLRLAVNGGPQRDALYASTLLGAGSTGRAELTLLGASHDDDLSNVFRDESAGGAAAVVALDGGDDIDHCLSSVGAVENSCELGDQYERLIEFGGQLWGLKFGERRGPGPNDFSDSTENVSVDESGQLQLRITNRDGDWQSAGAVAIRPLGFGTYTWTFAADIESLDPWTVLGLFLYRDDWHEIDFELSQWGDPANQNAQWVVHPSSAESKTRFDTGTTGVVTCSLDWTIRRVVASCWAGEDRSVAPLATWTYRGERLPRVPNLHARINFWLFRGTPPSNGQEHDMTIRSFDFVPAA